MAFPLIGAVAGVLTTIVNGVSDHLKDRQALKKAVMENRMRLAQSDAEFNHDAYVEVLQLWTEEINTAQQTWHLQMQYPMANAAALANASGFLVGDTGLVAHLDAIGFELTDEDTEQLRKGDDE